MLGKCSFSMISWQFFPSEWRHKIHKLSQTPLSFHRLSRPWKAYRISPKLLKTFKDCANPVSINEERMYLWWFMCLVFTCMPGESYSRQLLSLLLCDVFRAPINSFGCWFCTGTLGLILFKNVILRSAYVCVPSWISLIPSSFHPFNSLPHYTTQN